jgi:hypothetical protein
MWQLSKMAKVKKKLFAAQKVLEKRERLKGKKIFMSFHEC